MNRERLRRWRKTLLSDFSWKRLGLILLGTAIASFGIYNIHQQTNLSLIHI